MITNLDELGYLFGAEPVTWERSGCYLNTLPTVVKIIEHRVYKDSESGCCCWIQIGRKKCRHHEGSPTVFNVSGYVEGWDGENQTYSVELPCEEAEIWEAIEMADADADEAWNLTHGCTDCNPEGWWDIDEIHPGTLQQGPGGPINKECKTCSGYGVIM